MSLYDKCVLLSIFGGLATFIVLHACIFRFVSQQKIFSWLTQSYLIGLGVNLGLMGYLGFTALGVSAAVYLLVISFLTYSLLAFGYVLGILGPYESSIRLRLVRALYRVYPKEISFEELLKDYNDKVILDNRLQRFLGSSEVLRNGREYSLGKTTLVFSLIDFITDILKKIYQLKATQ